METPIIPGDAPRKDKLHGQKTLRVRGFLEEFEVDDIKRKVDIVELFESFGVKLSGKDGNYTGLCPFHEDHTPSLSVDREQGLFNCFSGKCKAKGSVVDAVMNFKNTDFKGAMSYLKGFKPVVVRPSVSVPAIPERKKPEPVEAIDLKVISGYYHKQLFDHSEALEYLRKRGLANPALYERFQIGYSDGSLNQVIGESQRQALTEAGIFSEKGKEHFLNCLVFPIMDENQNVVSFYGRDIDDSSGFKHRYLKGPHKGVFNRKASKVYDEIILAECIIDALSLIETGFENVQAVYGTNGFMDEHLEILKTDRVKTVVIALDNDEGGQKASEALKERLISEGFRVKIISPFNGLVPEVKDWNEVLTTGATDGKFDREEFRITLKALIEQTAIFEKEDELTGGRVPFNVREEKGQYYFTYSDSVTPITYRLTGVKEMFANSLKVTVKAESNNDYFIDTVDFYLYRSRSNFAAHLSSQFGMELKRIEKDLLNILEYLEKRKDEKLEKEKPSKIELTEDDRQAGLELLKSPTLFDDIVNDMNVLGYAGEDVNKQLVYLAGTSRLMPKPLSVYIQSGAGSGKSYLIETVLKLMPPEKVNSITSASDRAFNYLEEEKLLDSILAMGEALHNEEIEGDIRQMQSENMISRSVTQKDQKTGELKTVEVKKKVRLCFMMTSTALKLNPENASRCLVLNVDESRAQTERVMDLQRYKRTFNGYLENRHIVPGITRKHISAQRMLKAQNIFNPFSQALKFPLVKSIMRRAHEQFLTLIDSVCFLQQYKKGPVALYDPYAKEEIQGLECGLDDYGIARRLFIDGGILTNIYDFPAGMVELYEEIRKLSRKRASKGGIKVTETSIIQTDIRGLTDLSNESVKRYVRMLVEFEFLKIVGGKQHGTRFSYCLREDAPIKGLELEGMIPTAEEMAAVVERIKTGNSITDRKLDR